MKRIIISSCLFLIIINIQTFANEFNDEVAKIHEAQEANLVLEKIAVKNSMEEDLLNLQESISGMQIEPNDVWCSADPKDLDPIRGTKWQFTFTILTEFTDILEFGRETHTTDDGTVALNSKANNYSDGFVSFCDGAKLSGLVFTSEVESRTLISYHEFTVNGTTASGYYSQRKPDYPRPTNFYPMTGIMLGPSCLSELIYGEHSEQAELLRAFRDNILAQTLAGQEIIRLYYQWSPEIVEAMENNAVFKEEVKGMIDGVLELIGGEVE